MERPNIAGIIAEYNPFHNGHLYHLCQTHKKSGADYTVVLLSGCFTQRGLPAIYDTPFRAFMALKAGADAVFEIPAPFSCSGAKDYASFGVSLLGSLGASHIAFGTEKCDVIELLSLARVINENSPIYNSVMKDSLKSGMTWPLARLSAIEADFMASGGGPDMINRSKQILSTPNNVLALEYARALILYRSPLHPISIDRIGSSYNETELDGQYSSASAIREFILNRHYHADDSAAGSDTENMLYESIPDFVSDMLGFLHPLSPDVFTGPIVRKISDDIFSGIRLDSFYDVSEDLANRITDVIKNCRSYDELITLIKTRQYTYTRISRALIHIYLGITKAKMNRYKENRLAPYARLIGFRKESEALFSYLKESSSVPILSKAADADRVLDNDDAFSLLMEEVHASDLYHSLYFDTWHEDLPGFYEQKIIII